MRKTKCKECNGYGIIVKGYGQKQAPECHTCQGTGQIEVFTIQELREGKVAVINDGTTQDLNYVIGKAFDMPKIPIYGLGKYYFKFKLRDEWCWNDTTDLPTQSVKIFLEEIEQEEKIKNDYEDFENLRNIKSEEPEFKWGEEVEWSDHNLARYYQGQYACINPKNTSEHIIITDLVDGMFRSVAQVRKPQKITLTLSQIAEKFNYDRDKINVDLEK